MNNLEKRGFEYGVIHHLTKKKEFLLSILKSDLLLSEQHIQDLLHLGAIYLNGQRYVHDINANPTIEAAAYLRIHTKPRRFATDEILNPARFVYQNSDFIIFNKPAGVPCHPTVDNIQENLVTVLCNKLRIPLYITHRLDNPTEGLLLIAKSKEFQKLFNQLLQRGSVTKIYQAEVQGQPSWRNNQILTHYMKPSPRAPKEVSSEKKIGWAECQLKILNKNGHTLTIELLTGRTHQIRSQLAYEGFPILGDHLYGASKNSEKEAIKLKAIELQFLDYNFKIENEA